jgi:hypothetical protein
MPTTIIPYEPLADTRLYLQSIRVGVFFGTFEAGILFVAGLARLQDPVDNVLRCILAELEYSWYMARPKTIYIGKELFPQARENTRKFRRNHIK